MIEFQIFKQIEIGGISKAQLIENLETHHIQFNKYAYMLFEHSLFSTIIETKSVKLVKLNSRELGFEKPVFFQQIVDRALSLNLGVCPLSLGAFLRLAYLDQPDGPYLTIASYKPEAGEEFPNGFYVRNFEGSLWLRGYRASDDYEWPLEHDFIFVK